MAKAYAHQRDRSMSPSSEECVAAGMLHKRAANGAHANGTGALRAATQPEEHGCASGNGNGKDNRHAAVGGARPRPLDVPALSLWEQYVRANRTHPLQTKCITTGVLMATGNFGAQLILNLKGKQKGIIYKKLVAFVVFGVFLSGPLGHAWLRFLNGHKTSLKGQSLILYKIALDRLGYGPAFNLLMMSFVYKLSGQSWKQVLASLKKTFWSAQVLNWKMWPVAQYINFNFIPPELQLLYMNVVALFWTIGLSIIMN